MLVYVALVLVVAAFANAQCDDVTKCSTDVSSCVMGKTGAAEICPCYATAAKCFMDADTSDSACKSAADTASKGFDNAANALKCGDGTSSDGAGAGRIVAGATAAFAAAAAALL